MKALATLPPSTQVFVDANIFAIAMLDPSQLGQRCRTFLERTEHHEVEGFTATFVVADVIHRVMIKEARDQVGWSSRATVEHLQKHPELVRQLTRHLRVPSELRAFGIDILPLTVQDLHASKHFRSTYGLLTNDSLILGVMDKHKLKHLATHDAGFARVANIQVWGRVCSQVAYPSSPGVAAPARSAATTQHISS